MVSSLIVSHRFFQFSTHGQELDDLGINPRNCYCLCVPHCTLTPTKQVHSNLKYAAPTPLLPSVDFVSTELTDDCVCCQTIFAHRITNQSVRDVQG